MNQVSLVNPVERYMSLRIQQYTFASAMKETQCPPKGYGILWALISKRKYTTVMVAQSTLSLLPHLWRNELLRWWFLLEFLCGCEQEMLRGIQRSSTNVITGSVKVRQSLILSKWAREVDKKLPWGLRSLKNRVIKSASRYLRCFPLSSCFLLPMWSVDRPKFFCYANPKMKFVRPDLYLTNLSPILKIHVDISV